MSTQQQTSAGEFPANWHIAKDYDPNDHLMNLKGRDYLNVQNRLLWFIRDQRAFISSGLARMPYFIHTDLVEMDTTKGFAHFKTTVRDVLGNEATMYGSETAKDFGDYAEKASTKSLGRALLALGYGTAFAPEMDEGERVVDSPVERKHPPQPQQQPSTTNKPATITPANVTDWNALMREAAELGVIGAAWSALKRSAGDNPDMIRQQLNSKRLQQQAAAS